MGDRRFPAALFLIAAYAGTLTLARPAGAFTLIEKLVPLSVEITPIDGYQNAELLYTTFTDAQHTQAFSTGATLGVLLPAVQKTVNLTLRVPLNDFDQKVTVLMGDGSVRLATALNTAGEAMALGPPAQTFNQMFLPYVESNIINALATNDQTTLNGFFAQFTGTMGLPLNSSSSLISFSTAALGGSDKIIQRPQGDANFDGTVDFKDLMILARHYGQGAAAGVTWADGDFNGDGSVDYADLLILAHNYGKTIIPPAVAASGPQLAPAIAEVPEPTVGCAAALAAALPLLGRARRRT